MPTTTRCFVLARRPDGLPTADLFELAEEPLAGPAAGQFLVRLLWIGTDPGPVGRMRAESNYAPRIELGDVMPSHGVGQVIASAHRDVAVGRLLMGQFGWREHVLRDSLEGLFDVDPAGPPSMALGLLGLQGLTAYVGFLDVGAPAAGETVVVSAAGGSVGIVVGQLAKIHGCRVVGIAGGAEKAATLVDAYGFDACVDRRAPDVGAALAAACPDGVDIYFDNVGGALADALLPLYNVFGRIVVCGRIALAGLTDTRQDVGPRDLNTVLVRRLRKQGVLVYDHLDRLPEARERLWAWHAEGRLELPESVLEGFEALPEAFAGMLAGDNLGRRLVHVADPDAGPASS